VKVWIDRSKCAEESADCDTCLRELIAKGTLDRSCILTYRDDGRRSLTIVVHGEDREATLIIPPNLRERIGRDGWSKYLRRPRMRAPEQRPSADVVESSAKAVASETAAKVKGAHSMRPTSDVDTLAPLGKKTTTRRGFLGWAIGAIGAVITAAMGIPAVAYVVSPALKKKVTDWIPVGSIRKVKVGEPTLFKVKIERKQGWEKTVSNETMYALTEDGKDFIVLSNICTHLGCRVHWDSAKNGFFCPCHGGIFDKQGNVVAGPPPRPLDRFESKVENGKLYILGG